ncbi:MAG TPA: GIY-YIG nuclease family protein [Gemmatimonadales bacterium]|nr:GIY-YIG nuclease family protein [Gemmatimonadales bacterium]
MSEFYVYALVDPRSDQPFYIGKGKGRRCLAHEREARGTGDSMKLRRIRAIWSAGHQVVIRMLATALSEAEALDLERRTIAARRPELTNISPGGGPLSVLPECQETVELRSRVRSSFLARLPLLRQLLAAHSHELTPRDRRHAEEMLARGEATLALEALFA